MKVYANIDWDKVAAHADRVSKSKTRIHIDPECLRWTPLITPTVNPFRSDSDLDTSGDKNPQENSDDEKDIKEPVEEIVEEKPVEQVKVKGRRGRKSKKMLEAEASDKAVTETEIEKEYEKEKEIELTSSGRKRIRPSKYDETTYADIKKSDAKANETVLKRKLSESNKIDSEPVKKVKSDDRRRSRFASSGNPKLTAESKVEETKPMLRTCRSKSMCEKVENERKPSLKTYDFESDTQSDQLEVSKEFRRRIRKASIVKSSRPRGERWSERREKRLKLNSEIESNSDSPMPELKREADLNPELDEDFSAPKLSPQNPVHDLEEEQSKTPKIKVGRKRGRKSKKHLSTEVSAGKRQTTLPEIFKQKEETVKTKDSTAEESQTACSNTEKDTATDNVEVKESIIEKSSKPVKDAAPDAKPRESHVKKKHERISKPRHRTIHLESNSKSEDSSAEADDEFEDEKDMKSPKKDKIIVVSDVIRSVASTSSRNDFVASEKSPKNKIIDNKLDEPQTIVENKSSESISDTATSNAKPDPTNNTVEVNENPSDKSNPETIQQISETCPDKAKEKSEEITAEEVEKIEEPSPKLRKEEEISTASNSEPQQDTKQNTSDTKGMEKDEPKQQENNSLPNEPQVTQIKESTADCKENPNTKHTSTKQDVCADIETTILSDSESETEIDGHKIKILKVEEKDLGVFKEKTDDKGMLKQEQPTGEEKNKDINVTQSTATVVQSESQQTESNNDIKNSNIPVAMEVDPKNDKPNSDSVIVQENDKSITSVDDKERSVIDVTKSQTDALSVSTEQNSQISNIQEPEKPTSKSQVVIQHSCQKVQEQSVKKTEQSCNDKIEPSPSKSEEKKGDLIKNAKSFDECDKKSPEKHEKRQDNKSASQENKKSEHKKDHSPQKSGRHEGNKTEPKISPSKHEKSRTHYEQKSLTHFKYEKELPKPDYASLNQMTNYPGSHAPQYHWQAAWDHPARLQWEQNRYLDMKSDKNPYFDPKYAYNVQHLEPNQKSPQKIHHKYNTNEIAQNFAYTSLAAPNIYQSNVPVPQYPKEKINYKTETKSDKSRSDHKKPTEQKVSEIKPDTNKQANSRHCNIEANTSTTNNSTSSSSKSSSKNKQLLQQEEANKIHEVPKQNINTNTQCSNLTQQQMQQNTLTGQNLPNQMQNLTHTSIQNHANNQKNVVELTDVARSGNTTPRLDNSVESLQPHTPSNSIKQTPPTPSDIPSMGVYTPDSTTNSVHSLHYGGPCDLDVQLGLESPTSISSDMASQNSVEPVRPPSVVPHNTNQTQYSDCSMQSSQSVHNQMQIQHSQVNIPTSSPQHNLNSTIHIPPISQTHIQQGSNSNRKQVQHQSRNTNRSTTPKIRSTAPSIQHSSIQQSRHRDTPPIQTTPQQQSAVSQQQQQQQHTHVGSHQHHQLQAHLQHAAMAAHTHQTYGHLGTASMHHATSIHPHAVISQGNYISMPQMAVSSQGFQGQGASTYVSVPMSSVIQHRMSNQGSIPTAQHPLPSPHQRHGSSPSCAVSTATNFYIQSGTHPHSHTPGPSAPQTPTPTATPTPQGNPVEQTGANTSFSLAKLQQLANGLEMNQTSPCNTMTPPPVPMNLTPPPNHHPHGAMTPPPGQVLANQPSRNLPTPPNIQSQVGLSGYHHKYYSSNMNMNQLGGTVTPPMQQNSGRNSRNLPANVAVQHMQASSSRMSPNVPINPNLMTPYGGLNGYRMATQQSSGGVAGYIAANTAAGFINNPGQLQMGVMNMAQGQYQDPSAIQRAAQQNPMNPIYPTYSYINGIGPMTSLNGTMRR